MFVDIGFNWNEYNKIGLISHLVVIVSTISFIEATYNNDEHYYFKHFVLNFDQSKVEWQLISS